MTSIARITETTSHAATNSAIQPPTSICSTAPGPGGARHGHATGAALAIVDTASVPFAVLNVA